MSGNRRPRYPSGGGCGTPPPHQPQPPQLNPNFAFQNLNLLYHQQLHPNPNTVQPQIQTQTQSSPQPQKLKKEVLKKIDNAVLIERNRIRAAGECVTAWKICQWLTLMLEVDSWSSLGFEMKEVPSLRKLMVIEDRINAFIHCFVAFRKISTLYDLEEAICMNESIGTFEELELGPFLRHQLVMHYFSVDSDVTEVVKITNNDIINFLSEYLDTHEMKAIKIDEFLDFIANKLSLASKEKLGVRIQSLKMHIKFIWEARKSEDYLKEKKEKRRSEDDGKDVKLDEPGILLSDKSTRMFITTWKKACKDHTADEMGKKNTTSITENEGSGKPKAIWNDDLVAIFCEICVKEVAKGNMPGTRFDKIGWVNIVNSFKEITGKDYDKKQLKNKWNSLKTDWKLWSSLLQKETDIGWDPAKKTVDASPKWWQSKIEMNVEYRKFRDVGISPDMMDMYDKMFKGSTTVGNCVMNQSSTILLEERVGDSEHDKQTVDRENEEASQCDQDRGKRRTNDDSDIHNRVVGRSKGKKGKLGCTTKLSKKIDRLVEVVESRSTATSMHKSSQRSSIVDVMEDVATLPGVEKGSQLWWFATELFCSQDKREMFSIMTDPDLKLQFLILNEKKARN